MNDKSKDTNKARQYLEELGIRNELWLTKKGNEKFLKPHPKYSFTPEKRRKFCEFIKGVKLPDRFGQTLSQNRDQRLTTQCSGVLTPSDKDGTMYYGVLEEILELDYLTLDDAYVIHDNMSSDLALTANLEDLDHTSLSGVGPSTEVEYTPTRSLVDDDDFTDDELDVPHDFSSDFDCDSEDHDNQSVMALVQGRGHGGDNSPPNDDVPWQPPSECKNEKARKKARDLTLKKKFANNHKKPLPIKFDIVNLETVKPIGPNARDFTSLIGNEIKQKVPFYYDSWENIPKSCKTTLWPKIKGFFDLVPWLKGSHGVLIEKWV
ncbi:hypothetical protein Tco_0960990, partial [Tanacetum coccineum]